MKNALLMMLSVLFSSYMLAQPPHHPRGDRPPRPSKERMEALRIAFITEELSLTPEESKNFWPIFNEFHSRMKELKKDRPEKLENVSDADLDKHMDAMFTHEEKAVALKREFYQKLKGVLPARKAARAFTLEKKFRQKLLDRVREHGDRPEGGRPDKED